MPLTIDVVTIKLLHTSDWHVGRRLRGRDRSEEHRDVVSEIVAVARDNDVDLTVVAGDLFDASAPSPVSEQIVWRALLDLAEVGPVIVVAGNHDSPARLDAVAPLLEMAGVHVVGSPVSADAGGVYHSESLGVKIAALPFVSRRGIVRAEEIMASDPDQHAGLYEDRLRRIVGTLTSTMTTETVNLLVSHLTVHGAESGGGEHIFDFAVPASLFPGHLSYVALGHYHRQQKMPHAAPVWYSGSPLQLDFGEVEDAKGVLLVDVAPGKPAKVTVVPVTGGARLVTLRGTLEQVIARADDVVDAYVKVHLDEPSRVGLADEVRAAIPGAVDVVLERRESGAKPQEPRRSLRPADAFHRYLVDKGVDDEALKDLFSELLDEVVA